MDQNFDFLSDMPDDVADAHAASNINTPLTSAKPGSGMELGEMGLGGFDDSSSVTVDTAFQPRIPSDAAFEPRLAFEIALGFEPPDEIYPRYNMSQDDWYHIAVQPAFKAAVLEHQKDITENGISYRLKAKIQAEAYLKDLHLLIKNPLTSPSVKLESIKYVTKVSNLEPKPDKEDQGTTFNLQINL